MNKTLEIDGRTLCPIKDAAQTVAYSRDYIAQLARGGKIFATQVGRQWYIDLISLQAYVDDVSTEQEIRNEHLSQERKRDIELRSQMAEQATLSLRKRHNWHMEAAVMAMAVLMVGVFGGWVVQNTLFNSVGETAKVQVANTSASQDQNNVMPDTTNVNTAQQQAVPAVPDTNQDTSQSLSSLGDVAQGILLLPEEGASAPVSSLFSDRVIVKKQPDGTYTVQMVDINGVVLGEEIPFVMVPVDSSSD